MLEINKISLANAIQSLPTYSPSLEVWELIEMSLETQEMLNASLPKLPNYSPSVSLWDKIEAELEADELVGNLEISTETVVSQKKTFFEKMSFLTVHLSPNYSRNFLQAVAAIFIVMVASVWFLKSNIGFIKNTDEISITQEVIDNQVLMSNIEGEDPTFNMVNELCRERVPVCEVPAFKTLKSELDELTRAKSELKIAIGKYNDDPNLVAQIVKIEQERSALLQKMVQMI
jgi:hypothetical protein